MEITLDALNHLNLLAGLVEGDGVWVVGAKENLKDLEGVAVEGITRDLLLTVDISTLEAFFAIAIICFSKLGRREDLKCFANLTELEVSLSHRLRVLKRVESDGQHSELLSDVLVACIGAHTQRLVIVLAHLYV